MGNEVDGAGAVVGEGGAVVVADGGMVVVGFCPLLVDEAHEAPKARAAARPPAAPNIVIHGLIASAS